MEGSRRQAQSPEELSNQLTQDVEAISKFFNKAKTDSPFLSLFDFKASPELSAHVSRATDELIEPTMKLQALLVNTLNIDSARTKISDIIKIASDAQVALQHPLTVCAVACLYGSGPARGVLKPAQNPTEEGAYNAVIDIRHLMDTAYIRELWNRGNGMGSVRLLSRDKNLNNLARMFQLAVSNNTVHGCVEFCGNLDKDLFPNLKNNQKMQEVFEELGWPVP